MAPELIAQALVVNGEQYHAGTVSYGTFCDRSNGLWMEAERAGVARAVSRVLRTERTSPEAEYQKLLKRLRG